MRRRISLTGAVVLVASSALAFQTINVGSTPTRWPGARATIYHDPAWASSYPQFVNELSAALSPWSSVQGSNFNFFVGGASPSATLKNVNNRISDVYWDDLSPSTYAVTWVTHAGGAAILDRDVAFNTDWTWTTTGVGGPDFRSVAIHEFGHVLGLAHETSKTSVMRPYYDGYSQEHTLYFDDKEACRFLYPEPPTPPAPPTDADLVLDTVSFGPADSGSGDTITIDFSMRNVGTAATGTFAVTAYLAETIEISTDDRYLGDRIQASVAVGASRDGSINVTLPDLPDPRVYRIGLILDAQGATGDQHPENNVGVATQTLQGGGDALEIAPGYRVTGQLLPFGRESLVMDLLAGTRLDVRAALDNGSLRLTIVQEEGAVTLTELRRFRRARGRVTVPADGRYLVYVDSDNGAVTPYEVVVGAKPIKVKATLDVSAADLVFLPGYRGTRVSATVRSRSAARPTAEWAGLESVAKGNRKGTKVKLKSLVLTDTGPLVLALSRGDGPVGAVEYQVVMKVPKKGPLVQR